MGPGISGLQIQSPASLWTGWPAAGDRLPAAVQFSLLLPFLSAQKMLYEQEGLDLCLTGLTSNFTPVSP